MRSTLFLVFAVAMLIASCSSPSDTTVTIGASMTGTVKLYNTDAGTYETDASGATIALVGTTYRATSDAAGKWSLNNIPPGIYNIEFTKAGYDTSTVVSHKFSGAGVDFIDEVTLHQLPLGIATLDSIGFAPPFSGDSNIHFYGTYRTAVHPPITIQARGEGTNANDPAVWQTIEAGTPKWKGDHFDLQTYLMQLRHRVFGSITGGGTIYVRADLVPMYGHHVQTNELRLDIPADSLVIDAVQLDQSVDSRRDSGLSFSCRLISEDPHRQSGIELFASDNAGGPWRQLGCAVTWTGLNFVVRTTEFDAKYAASNRQDTVARTAYFRVQYESLYSNVVSTYLP